MRGASFDDLERAFDRHARRIAGELGGLLVDVGEALRRQAQPREPAPGEASEPTREDLLREAAALGVRGRSRMSKDELRLAVEQARGR
jgi:hypothetical protein